MSESASLCCAPSFTRAPAPPPSLPLLPPPSSADDLYERSPDIPVDADGFLIEHGRLSYSILLGFGAAFYPCASCCNPAGPKKPVDGRGGGRDDLV